MRHEAALILAAQYARELQQTWLVYRFPKWPTGEYAIVSAARGLPPEADIERIDPPSPDGAQGSLFT